MSDSSTKAMIEMHKEDTAAPLFLTGFFRSTPRNFHTTEEVELDIIREDEDVAIVVTDMSAGANLNEATRYTNKSFTPPVFKEAGVISAFSQIKRRAGQNPFEDPDFAANAAEEAMDVLHKIERKIHRSIELQASQVLQTGVVTLTDSTGTTRYTLNYGLKSSHFVNSAVPWAEDGSTGNPLGDVSDLADDVRRDGKKRPSRLVFGSSAFRRFLANADVKARLDNRSMQVGSVAPEVRGEGATFQGWVWIGHYRFEMWTYDGFYKNPQSGDLVPFVADNSVIMLSDGARLDLSFGAIPSFLTPEQRVLDFLPARISNPERGMDISTASWMAQDGSALYVQAGTRPLCIPTAGDTFGCLTALADS